MGMTDDPEIPDVSSVGDYLARRIALDWLPFDTRKDLGILTAEEEANLPSTAYAPTPLIRRVTNDTNLAPRSARTDLRGGRWDLVQRG
jgi:hypothetical protein